MDAIAKKYLKKIHLIFLVILLFFLGSIFILAPFFIFFVDWRITPDKIMNEIIHLFFIFIGSSLIGSAYFLYKEEKDKNKKLDEEKEFDYISLDK